MVLWFRHGSLHLSKYQWSDIDRLTRNATFWFTSLSWIKKHKFNNKEDYFKKDQVSLTRIGFLPNLSWRRSWVVASEGERKIFALWHHSRWHITWCAIGHLSLMNILGVRTLSIPKIDSAIRNDLYVKHFPKNQRFLKMLYGECQRKGSLWDWK